MLASCASVPTLSMMIPLVPPSSGAELRRLEGILPLVTLADITQPVPRQFVKGSPILARSPDCTLRNMKSVPVTPPVTTLGLKSSVTGEHCPAAPVVLPNWRVCGLAVVSVPSEANATLRSVGTSDAPLPQIHIWPVMLPGELLKYALSKSPE